MSSRDARSKRPKVLEDGTNIQNTTELRVRSPLDCDALETPRLRIARIPPYTVTIDFPSVRLQAVEKAKSGLTEEWIDHSNSRGYYAMVADLDACGFIHPFMPSGCGSHPLPGGLEKEYKRKKKWFFTHHRNLYLLKQKFDLHWILAWRWENDKLL